MVLYAGCEIHINDLSVLRETLLTLSGFTEARGSLQSTKRQHLVLSEMLHFDTANLHLEDDWSAWMVEKDAIHTNSADDVRVSQFSVMHPPPAEAPPVVPHDVNELSTHCMRRKRRMGMLVLLQAAIKYGQML